jgi:hypothetical protein
LVQTDEERKAKRKEYNSRPEVKAKKKKLKQTSEVKAKRKEYLSRPEVKVKEKRVSIKTRSEGKREKSIYQDQK